MIRLAHYFNKRILVCIPALFEDQQPRCFKLVGIEEFGLWLESEELAELLQAEKTTRSPEGGVAAFFPFSHIAYVTPEAHPLALATRPAIPVETTQQKRSPSAQPPKTEHRQRQRESHRKGKK